MKILALETSCERGSVALMLDGDLVERALSGSASGHSANILPLVREMLAEAGIGVSALDCVAFGSGPGAFTGLRLACGVAQGLALGVDRPVAPINSLLALAEPIDADLIYCAADARMNEAYVARFQRQNGALVQVAEAECVPPQSVPVPPEGGWRGVGTAFRAYPAIAERFAGHVAVLDPEAVPLAGAVARLAARDPAAWIDPALAAPEYVRNHVALTVAERLAQGGKA
ncbi:tRNA (adenosine(37)-N6)-threonylcarbamoyltransferase complex dimerization subunit type 1 TsaB [Uliginosibacterium sp. sgz301328]|uniref:tRNA (adenosine(37)-N6)-threonylcarbamoyltransferase complex dimerization subunit type 1 TsaB n=1 Tax=Uliginosibacterium sp. sgz301328 TaxID=3243764 RepID=UPI00359CC4A5